MKRNKWGIVEAGNYSVVVDQEQPGFDDMSPDDKISYSIATCYWSTHKKDAIAIANGLNLIRYSNKEKLDENDSGVRVDSSIILGSIFCSLLLILVIVYLAFRYLIL